MPPNKKSVVWEFFKKSSDGNKLICDLCSAQYKTTGSSTTKLINHLKKKHIVQYAEATGMNRCSSEENYASRPGPSSESALVEPEQVRVNLIRSCPPTSSSNVAGSDGEQPLPPPSKRPRQMRLTAPTKINQKAGDEALLDLIVLDMQPLQIVENEGFIGYTKKLNPDYVLPSRQKLTRLLEDRYNVCSAEVKEKLQSVQDIV